MAWRDQQSGFAEAVRKRDRALPEVLAPDAAGRPPERRFSVYRNNHVLSLVAALVSRFPVVEAVTGSEFCREMARAFVLSSPPQTPVLLHYGAAFGDFVETFAPAGGLPFLPDLARLEWAINESYHAGDAEPCGIAALAELAARSASGLTLTLHPSLRLVRSPFPVFSIWSAHQGAGQAVDLAGIALEAEAGVVVRPSLVVDVMRVDPVVHSFLARIGEGQSLDDASNALAHAEPAALAGLLRFVFEAGCIVAVAAHAGHEEPSQ